ncbi:hypothetical protein M2399_002214 [Pseudomonas sp. BIGb0450]|uniref:hypothetical protein n=1 Tax=unclassified Pseudomonas TaxID=196821 RepID=UPI00216923F7|nr:MULTISPECIES: hypothetical protein [unclassified Pseudomonas]MCS3416874.1 hypothetical protein [Pseudomonas sp. BIGb0558]MCS3436781.1 hypothetical protein [Pseudomonas sp. BIGb0450]
MSNFIWYCFDRTNLPEALFAVGELTSLFGGRQDELKPEEELTIGYVDAPSKFECNNPALLVISDSKGAEVLAWVSTYSPESFPLSQFSRLVKYSDYQLLKNKNVEAKTFWPRKDRWASVVLGEILAQGDSDISIGGLPLSRAQAVFTTPIAKSAILHGNDDVVELCIDRLRLLEKDRDFVERSVSIDELLPIWKKIGIVWDETYPIKKLMDLLPLPDSKTDLFSSGMDLRQYPDLLSDSAEKRVLAFRKFIREVSADSAVDRFNPLVPASLAISAFFVGRSTSHVFLLKEISKDFPTVFVWFGLVAALMGPTFWDVNWSRAVKGIEKGFHSRFDWVDPSQADLSWVEYSWLNKVSKSSDPFADIPKLLPKVLSLEIIPGAVCQFRLKGSSFTPPSQETVRTSVQAAKLKELESALAEFISLSDRAKERLGVGFEKVPIHEVQGSEVGEAPKVVKKNRRSNSLAKKST